MSRWFLTILFGLVLSLGLHLGVAVQADASVALILSERGPAYEELADAFAARFGDRRGLRILYLDSLDAGGLQALGREVRLLVPVGVGSRTTKWLCDESIKPFSIPFFMASMGVVCPSAFWRS